MPFHIILGQNQPLLTPEYIGQEYFDQSTLKFFKAIGLTAADWQELGAGGGSSGDTIFSSALINDAIEGPGSFDVQAGNHMVYIGFGGPGTKTVNLPTGLEPNKAHTYYVLGNNTEGSSITVTIGNGTNVSWANATLPTYPTSGALVEVKLTTIDGGNMWYGNVINYS